MRHCVLVADEDSFTAVFNDIYVAESDHVTMMVRRELPKFRFFGSPSVERHWPVSARCTSIAMLCRIMAGLMNYLALTAERTGDTHVVSIRKFTG